MTKEDIIKAMREHLSALQQLVLEAEEVLDWDENMILGQVSDGIRRARLAVRRIEHYQAE